MNHFSLKIVLVLVLAFSTGMLVGFYNYKEAPMPQKEAELFILTEQQCMAEAVEDQIKLENFETGDMVNRKVADLYAKYLCQTEGTQIKKTIAINYSECLKNLWIEKAILGNTQPIQDAGLNLVTEYQTLAQSGQIGKTNITDYLSKIEKLLKELKANVDWSVVKERKMLSNQQLLFVKKQVESLTAQDILSYAMTEIFPARSNGAFNYAMLDFLLQTAGEEFVNRIPSLNDRLLSLGMFQFTELAIAENEGAMGGASVVNLALPEMMQISNGVEKMTDTEEHYTAAFLFVINNVADGVRGLNKNQLAMWSQLDDRKSDLVQFIATAHHGPVIARKCLARWLDSKAKKPFHHSCGKAYSIYAKKTIANRRAFAKIDARKLAKN